MPLRKDIKKVLVIGSGPIIIGQAAEFDYSGSQACKALKEEGIEVVLINSNPATIMTDKTMADSIYIEPINCEIIEKIIQKEKVDSILPTLGGQTGLNIAVELYKSGILDKYNVKVIGTNIEAIEFAEDRRLFKELMIKIGEPVVPSEVVTSVEDGLKFVEKIGFPVIIRPAYTLGGTGGGIANNKEEFVEIARRGLTYSPVSQILVEKSIKGWKEIEYEVMRDSNGCLITVCNMENIDPVGIHTGDSIVVAPSQTLSDKEYQILRSSALKIIDALKIEGGCNVQFALNPDSFEYAVIEVNPRVSRSSALASKATGYPIARIAAKIALGFTLDEIENAITKMTYASFEPALDYVVLKIPRWPFDKFTYANRKLGTQMKATGEVMSIGRTFEESLLKGIRSLDIGVDSLDLPELKNFSNDELKELIKEADDRRIFALAEALRREFTIDEIYELCKVDKFFLYKIKNIIDMENRIKNENLDANLLAAAKKMGFGDKTIASLRGSTESEIRSLRKRFNIKPVYKMVDTCAAEFEAKTPYYYSTYERENDIINDQKLESSKKIVVLGSGPIRIGQGIEFDYTSVHSVYTLSKLGIKSVIINNNPETVSTDFDTSDMLFFEPLTKENVLNVIEELSADGVIVQFGGQTAIKLSQELAKEGVRIFGTSAEGIDIAEDRERFDKILNKLNIKRPPGFTCYNVDEALEIANKLKYPVLVRPSYVLGGQGMKIAFDDDDIIEMLSYAKNLNEHPILIDKYIVGKEIEVDAISDGEDILIPGIMEHIERAGVHSGDSISLYPARNISKHIESLIVKYTQDIARELKCKGLINVQFIVQNEELYVIEVNPRGSRTVPFLSKVTGVPMVELATKVSLGYKLKDLVNTVGLLPKKDFYAFKVPVFSFEKLPDVEVSLGPEMKSTGEVMGISKDYHIALYKGLIAAGIKLPLTGGVLFTVADPDKNEIIPIAEKFEKLGFKIYATSKTAKHLNYYQVAANCVRKVSEGSPNIIDLIRSGRINIVINTPTKGRQPQRDGFLIRRFAVENKVPIFTSVDTAKAAVEIIEFIKQKKELDIFNIGEIDNEAIRR
ncbi:carbamoyl-phosphate synthase large subunit [Caldicellulosiruptor naganoensis]|uniref:Carbamoyl phosphate synthase large chain n=1 Tax=Caldicellulosiruptor naganoensis TaxID=29324 RepID=A0ABY7BHT3_9FIRM|nr:carbamoyl-phosphate synthase large subunit [Caldicellulosiruptor naganoensis]WAM30601.1 carbamoyl-phosphate synthase large subunit [Caldicellulosiruptor naganoensis]